MGMQCEVCGRKLKSALSLARGVGPGCWKKMNKGNKKVKITSKAESAEPGELSIPGQMELDEWLNAMNSTEE